MRIDILVIMILFITSLVMFGYMRNRQARRNDQRREKLWEKQEDLLEMLRKKEDKETDQSSKEKDNDH